MAEMGKASPNGIVPFADTFSIFQEQARVGYVTVKEQTEAIKKAFEAGRDIGKRDAATGSSGRGVTGSAASNGTGPQSRAEAEQMLSNMHPSGRTITTDQFRAYRASHEEEWRR